MFRRMRRLRLSEKIRSLVQETRLSLEDFIYPMFVIPGDSVSREVPSMPGIFQMSIDLIVKECKLLQSLGVNNVLLFGIPDQKDEFGSHAMGEDFIIARCVERLKDSLPGMCVIADVCFCEYTSHGQCGILDTKTMTVSNDKTIENLAKQSVLLAKSGADVIAPSSMMDGQVWAIRKRLDNNGFENIPIMSYSTKFASNYYGPFRDAAESAPISGLDRRNHQLSFYNRREAILESMNDDSEGADILMVKPAMAYLDIVRDIRERTLLPLAVYNVSGEYSMLKAADKLGYLNYQETLIENMVAFKRAGADIIISYHTKEIASML